MVHEPEELTEVTRAKLRLRAIASQTPAVPAVVSAAPGILRLLRRPDQKPAATQTDPGSAAKKEKKENHPAGKTLKVMGVVAAAAAAVAAGFLLSRSPAIRQAADTLLNRGQHEQNQ